MPGLSVKVAGKNYELTHGDVVIAAITSCTNTSNPSVLVAAGLVARKAHAKGLKPKPWVKTSLAPGSQVVTEYLDKSGLTADLDAIGFETVGYGCTTCIGNSGPLDDAIVDAIEDNKLVGAAVISGNRNFEGRVHANVRANYLASPPLVVAYALLGKVTVDITTEPLGIGSDGQPVYLRDVWPTNKEIADVIAKSLSRDQFLKRYGEVFKGPKQWQAIRGRGRQRHLPLVGRAPPTSRTRPISTASRWSRRRLATSPAPGCWRNWATASPPTISARRVRSERRLRRGITCWSGR